ncbi:tRNA 2-selenouridine synthase [Tepidimonas alkaliphilus]|uniref:tRNA 2-selenouridine synthase n=1 Tax=Tepidimonas alkaliphilus TaxID=2588942 RepID=A0A554WBG5_9BURK|nr:tRNA 2-selenouridine(34) synthase MnmH [Tepidimonas alkaliphilus]TSE20914.1 tRNA 2-selenouridine synthase [Tepidimonas alkaliphilus]
MATKPDIVTLEALDAFDALIDARSPSEYAEDHLPGAVSCPVLDDDQRRLVGTLYKQRGPFEARRIGGVWVARNIARHVEAWMQDKPAHWRPLVYCWRGGQRSGSFVLWLRQIGWAAAQLQGGYKAYRRWVVQQLAELPPRLAWRVLAGPTGSGKTRLLHALAAAGAQVLDLEGLARHRGSILGAWPDGQPQPSQKAFDTALVAALRRLDPARPVWVEAESRKIGLVQLPEALHQALQQAPRVQLQVPFEARLALVLQDYAWLGRDPQALARRLQALRGLQPGEVLQRWQVWARQGRLPELFADLMTRHYDPLYQRHLRADDARATMLVLPGLDEATLAQAAAQLLAGGLARVGS